MGFGKSTAIWQINKQFDVFKHLYDSTAILRRTCRLYIVMYIYEAQLWKCHRNSSDERYGYRGRKNMGHKVANLTKFIWNNILGVSSILLVDMCFSHPCKSIFTSKFEWALVQVFEQIFAHAYFGIT